MTVAEHIAAWLIDRGVKHAFGIIGGGNVAIFDAIARGKETQIICCHHEQAAAMAAGYYYRASGHIAPAIVTTGAGSTNALTGVMAAWMDSVPLFVLSGNEASKTLFAGTRVLGVQGYDSSGVAKPMVKYAGRILPNDNPRTMLDGALSIALQARQGPVWLDVPKDVQTT